MVSSSTITINTTDKGTIILKSIGEKGPLDPQPVHHAYPTKDSLQPEHYQTRLVGTTYVITGV